MPKVKDLKNFFPVFILTFLYCKSRKVTSIKSSIAHLYLITEIITNRLVPNGHSKQLPKEQYII